MPIWCPMAILPNLRAQGSIEGDVVALASCHDPRVRTLSAEQPKLYEFLSRFTNAFHVPLQPTVLIVHKEVIPALAPTALVSFRDLVALCVVPYARSLELVYRPRNRIVYSDTFWLYPWMLDKNGEYLVASTPATQALHVVEEFHGQSSPELSPTHEGGHRRAIISVFDRPVETTSPRKTPTLARSRPLSFS